MPLSKQVQDPSRSRGTIYFTKWPKLKTESKISHSTYILSHSSSMMWKGKKEERTNKLHSESPERLALRIIFEASIIYVIIQVTKQLPSKQKQNRMSRCTILSQMRQLGKSVHILIMQGLIIAIGFGYTFPSQSSATIIRVDTTSIFMGSDRLER